MSAEHGAMYGVRTTDYGLRNTDYGLRTTERDEVTLSQRRWALARTQGPVVSGWISDRRHCDDVRRPGTFR